MAKRYASEEILLDPEMRSCEVLDFEKRLQGKIVGQDRAIRRIVNMYQTYLAGMAAPGRPVGSLLFLGPTGGLFRSRWRAATLRRSTPRMDAAAPTARITRWMAICC
jgi:hypothetical protein